MKRFFYLLAAVLLVLALALPSGAARQDAHIYDTAKLLTASEVQTLEQTARKLSEAQQCGVYLVTVEDFRNYGGGEIYDVARQIFLDNDFGIGEDQSGVMLLLSMEDRDYSLIAHGFGDTALTDYGKDYISEGFLDNFADDDWYGGCVDYLDSTGALLAQARAGNIYDVGSWVTSGSAWAFSLPPAMLLALIICAVQRMLMRKKVRLQSDAAGYLEDGAVSITRRRDVFTHATEVRQKIETDKSSSGSSGGHSHSSDGFSGKSGKF